ncbi:hypothetical protein BDD12DRAFT_935396, partial [Trichophaea hybrida]
TLLRSYVVPNVPFESVKILEAARATSAAPTFFKAQPIFSPKLGVKNFEWGLGHINPILHLIDEAESFYKDSEIGCIISIGTGVQPGRRLAAEGTARANMFGVPLVGRLAAQVDTGPVASALATSSKYINQFAESKFRGTDIYYRFNVQEGTVIPYTLGNLQFVSFSFRE